VPPYILVVEDEPLVARTTCRALEQAGFTCAVADSAGKALELIGGGTVPDLIVLDIRLPDLPGPELALRIHSRYARVPILFVSGWTGGLTDPDRFSQLRWDFLPKPFTGETLGAAVRRMLDDSDDGLRSAH
jgi:two-component system, cell cycle sensor histidine kinase and response regulator CckA